MPIRIYHKACNGLCGFWVSEPDTWDTFKSPNYRAPSLLPLELNEEVYCGKCNCPVTFHDVAWLTPIKPSISYADLLDPKRV